MSAWRRAFGRLLRAVVGRDGDRMLAAFAGLDDKDFRRCVGYGLAVVGHIVSDIYPEGPSEQDLDELAKRIIEGEADWIDLGDQLTVATFLGATTKDDPAVIDPSNAAAMAAEDLVGLHSSVPDTCSPGTAWRTRSGGTT